ncbi:MAG: Uma2 family endonuclease [Sulfurisoma sp.]|nr:Uma2 family endonuclease [Sulfurisoma sp.]
MSAVLDSVRHRVTVDEFYKMVDGGVFMEDDRVELIDGEMVDMAPIGSRHAGAVTRLNNLFASALAGRAICKVQDPLRLTTHSEPEPDLMLLKPRDDFYGEAHPGADDVLLLVEVCDTSARFDREVKLPLYARHGVVEVWLVDLEARVVEVCTGPHGEAGAYTERRCVAAGVVAPRAMPDCGVAVEPLFSRG